MKTLFTAVVLCLAGCGVGVDESVEPTASTRAGVVSTGERALDEPPGTFAEPMLTWEAVWAHIGLDAKLRAQALEARAFYTVDLGMTPAPTTPACPACN